jgi:hypothetical protein
MEVTNLHPGEGWRILRKGPNPEPVEYGDQCWNPVCGVWENSSNYAWNDGNQGDGFYRRKIKYAVHEWEWGTPWKPGVWAFGGYQDFPRLSCVRLVDKPSDHTEKFWCCFLADKPIINRRIPSSDNMRISVLARLINFIKDVIDW